MPYFPQSSAYIKRLGEQQLQSYISFKFFNLATRQSPRLRQRGMENGHVANGEALANVLVNGHAIFGETLQKIESNIQEQENIFLFIPNLIGELLPIRGRFSF